ncbi:hypothetical protein BS50DRAFT_576709 [Corynespora cassiicola Philippines]|uniref:GED domain-containing protein n=1 Tax=Corynespora cassiicola Philippines TaxID=1448308 RepID=A0A2T2NF83_CORCC|nr:hypothetical protein BS50DRAFT_576709 [Corynespora cassiicola Philippines]
MPASTSAQGYFLAELATSASNITRMGCDGIYEAPFFGSVDIDARVDAEQNFVRLRATSLHWRTSDTLPDEMKYFVDVVTRQVIERQLLAPLSDTLSPRSVAGYTDEKVQNLASEPLEVRQLRAHLESKRRMLEEGAEAFHAAVVGGG